MMNSKVEGKNPDKNFKRLSVSCKQTSQNPNTSRTRKKTSKVSHIGDSYIQTPKTGKNNTSANTKGVFKRSSKDLGSSSVKKETRIKEVNNPISPKGSKLDLGYSGLDIQFEEEEKKLPMSDEKESSKAKTLNIKDESNPKSTTEIISQFYRIGKVLGKGAFGKVNLAIDRKSKDLVAIKSINKHFIADSSSKSKIAQEVAILKRIDHQNIVCMKDHIETENHVIFVMELCAGGDLLNYVRKRRKLSENTSKVIFKQILNGLEYCHQNNVLHRDIKLDNILLDSKGEVKIGDFGVSKIVQEGEVMLDQ